MTPWTVAHQAPPGKSPGVGCHALLQEIFPTQGSNPGLPHCRRILYCLSHQGWFSISVHYEMITPISLVPSVTIPRCCNIWLYSPCFTFYPRFMTPNWKFVTSFFFFNWRIIALQNFVGFCQISTWISRRYTYVPCQVLYLLISLVCLTHSSTQFLCGNHWFVLWVWFCFVMFVHSFWCLDSTCKCDHTVFVFHSLTYFT